MEKLVESVIGIRWVLRVFGWTAIPFLRKYMVPAAKRLGADLLEFAAPKTKEGFTGIKKIKTAAKNVGHQKRWEISLVVVAGKRLQAESFQQNLLNKPVRRKEMFLRTKFFRFVKSVPYQPSVAVFGSLGGKVPSVDNFLSFHEQQLYPPTSIFESCRNFEVRMDRNWIETDVHGFQLEISRGS